MRFVTIPLPASSTPGWVTLRPVGVRGVFGLVGLHWQGSATARFAIRSARPGARFRRWTLTDAVAVPLGTHPGMLAGDAVWTGAANRLQVRVHGVVTHLVAVLVAPGPDPIIAPVRGRGGVLARPGLAAQPAGSPPAPPPIVLRAGWGANEAIRRGHPQIATRLTFVVVHHTLTPNGYPPSQAQAIVRAIYLYQVEGNGYSDMGYNFLIDAAGVVYEGRYGGVTRNVIGQATRGFDVGSASVALIGDFRTATPSVAQVNGLEHLIAWRLDTAHADPSATLRVPSTGNELYPRGTVVTVPAIAGARDVGPTDSPGNAAYALLPRIRQVVVGIGALHIWEASVSPAVVPVPFAPITIRARLSSPAAWTASITTTAGALVYSIVGTGSVVNATWNGSVIGGGPIPRSSILAWHITASTRTARASDVQGLFDGSGAPGSAGGPNQPSAAVANVVAAPTVLAPNPSGGVTAGLLSWNQLVPGSVKVSVVDAAGGAVSLIRPAAHANPGPLTASWAPTLPGGAPLPSGHYAYRLEVQPDGTSAISVATAAVDVRRQLAAFTGTPAISPKGTVAPYATITWTRLEAGAAQLRLMAGRRVVTNLALLYDQAPGPFTYLWAGHAADGVYTLQLLAPGAGGALNTTTPLLIDTTRPRLRARSRAGHGEWWVSLWTTKAGVITVRTRGRIRRTLVASAPRRFALRFFPRQVGRSRRVEFDASDTLGNTAAPFIITLPPLLCRRC